MRRLARRAVTVVVVALVTAGASLWWLYEGDVGAVVTDVQAAP
jgi:hypothetical protein